MLKRTQLSRLAIAHCVLFVSASATAATYFTAAKDYVVGSRPLAVSIADFNRDGRRDIAVANFGSNSVSVLFGTGGGHFGAPRNYTVAAGPNSIATGDLNKDGFLDVVTASSTGSVSVLRGKSDGTFRSALTFNANVAIAQIEVADLNGDGKLDIAAATSGGIVILYGKGDATFGSVRTLPSGATKVVRIADLNADGRNDIVAVTSQGISAYVRRSDGSFALTSTTLGNFRPQLAIADFNGDGKRDWVSLMPSKVGFGVVYLITRFGTGTGDFLPGKVTQIFVPFSLGVGRFNSDTRNDVAVTRTMNSGTVTPGITVMLGNGDGTFASGTPFNLAHPPGAIAVADLDKNGRADVVLANSAGNTITVLINTSN